MLNEVTTFVIVTKVLKLNAPVQKPEISIFFKYSENTKNCQRI